MLKLIKWGIIGGVVVIGAGAIFFGRDLFSYATSSGRLIRTAVKDSIPVRFEIQRARDLLDDLIPEMQANLRLVAQEEVEVASLEKEVSRDREVVSARRVEMEKLQESLRTLPASFNGTEPARKGFIEDAGRRFERFRSSEDLLASKEKLLSNRKRSLQVAIERLEKTRQARVELAAQIENLEQQFRTLQMQGDPLSVKIDDTKLAQTQRLLTDLKKRLDVAQRVLEREAEFSDQDPPKPVSAEALVQEMDDHLHRGSRPAAVAAGSLPAGCDR